MKLQETPLPGAYIVELDAKEDQRGYFARTYCRKEFSAAGLHFEVVQCNISNNLRKGTLRGMHYQVDPAAEIKLVQCVSGSIYDVIIDLRPQSKTYCRWFGLELSTANRLQLYVPQGFAHGFQTLEDNSAVYYLMSEYYAAQYSRGVRWDDPAFKIKWPLSDPIMTEKDRLLPDYRR